MEFYILSRRTDIDQSRIGAIAVEPAAEETESEFLSVKKRNRKFLISKNLLAATDGQIVAKPNSFIELPVLLDKGTMRLVLAGLAPAPEFMLVNPHLRRTKRIVRLRSSSIRSVYAFLGRHRSVYVKPAGATGSGSFVVRLRLCGKIAVETSDERLKSQKIPNTGKSLARFFGKLSRIMNACGRTPYFIVEEEIPALKLKGRNVDLRFLIQKRNGRYVFAASYAKIGSDGITANIGTGGRGSDIRKTLTLLTGSESKKLQKKMQSLSVRLVKTLFRKIKTKPALAAADFVIVRNARGFEPWLMEINQGPVCFSGLKSADKKAYSQVLKIHEDNLSEAVSRYKDHLLSP